MVRELDLQFVRPGIFTRSEMFSAHDTDTVRQLLKQRNREIRHVPSYSYSYSYSAPRYSYSWSIFVTRLNQSRSLTNADFEYEYEYEHEHEWE